MNSKLIAMVETIIRDVYNGQSLDRCDGRQLVDLQTKQVHAKKNKNRLRRSLQSITSPFGYVNEYPQNRCSDGRACAEAQVHARALCRTAECPPATAIALLSPMLDQERRLEENRDPLVPLDPQRERELYGLDSVIDVIYNRALCRAHFGQPGNLYDVPGWLQRFDQELMGRREFLESQIGAIHSLSEYVPIPAAGPPVDMAVSNLIIYAVGRLCREEKYEDKKGNEIVQLKVDQDMIYNLVEVIRRSYNDMAVQDCDAPLFRQLVSAALDKEFFKAGHFDCFLPELVLDISLTVRCHGHCDSGDPLFANHSSHHHPQMYHNRERGLHFRNMRRSATASTALNATMHKTQEISKKRSLGYDTAMGICALSSASNPKSPTLRGWEDLVNTFRPDAIVAVDVIWGVGPLCRCEDKDDPTYYVSSEYYHTVNGIHIVPRSKCPIDDRRQRQLVEYYKDDIFFC